jgi:hypothetical protein
MDGYLDKVELLMITWLLVSTYIAPPLSSVQELKRNKHLSITTSLPLRKLPTPFPILAR